VEASWIGFWAHVGAPLQYMVKLVIRKEQRQARYYTEFLEKNIGLEMTLIPGGTFLMGSPEDEPKRRKNESPLEEILNGHPLTSTVEVSV
jgi:formylglycine-generating enzyme required for sulfatase activity